MVLALVPEFVFAPATVPNFVVGSRVLGRWFSRWIFPEASCCSPKPLAGLGGVVGRRPIVDHFAFVIIYYVLRQSWEYWEVHSWGEHFHFCYD